MTVLVVVLMFACCAGYIRVAIYVGDEIYKCFPNSDSDCSLKTAFWPLTLMLYAGTLRQRPLPKATICFRKNR